MAEATFTLHYTTLHYTVEVPSWLTTGAPATGTGEVESDMADQSEARRPGTLEEPGTRDTWVCRPGSRKPAGLSQAEAGRARLAA